MRAITRFDEQKRFHLTPAVSARINAITIWIQRLELRVGQYLLALELGPSTMDAVGPRLRRGDSGRHDAVVRSLVFRPWGSFAFSSCSLSHCRHPYSSKSSSNRKHFCLATYSPNSFWNISSVDWLVLVTPSLQVYTEQSKFSNTHESLTLGAGSSVWLYPGEPNGVRFGMGRQLPPPSPAPNQDGPMMYPWGPQ